MIVLEENHGVSMTDKNERPPPRKLVHDLLLSLGYRLVDDSWVEHGRHTYLHDDNLSRLYIGSLAKSFSTEGWARDRGKMREFRHTSGEIIELEPGGSEVDGHFLHYMNEIESG
jgi:hypothetical protein